MNMNEYKKRIADNIIKKKLQGIGAVLIEGPKLCGKTTTAEQAAASVLYMANSDEREQNLQLAKLKPSLLLQGETPRLIANSDEREQNLQLAKLKPSLLLQGETPRLIDEWQIAPEIWDAVRFEVDHRKEFGQFILTGSAVPADRSKIFHSGTGRIAWVKMRTMSLYESGDSSGGISLKQ